MDERNRLGSRGVLYIISCASRPAQRVQDLVIMAQAEGWDVCVIATPQATKFVDIPLLEYGIKDASSRDSVCSHWIWSR